jgi:hypothetical protein
MSEELQARIDRLEQEKAELVEGLKALLGNTQRIRENACSCDIGEVCYLCKGATEARALIAKAEGKNNG